MAFNPDPTKQATEILFSRKRKSLYHPDLFFNGCVVSRSAEHQHLGMILQSKLSFEKHLNDKIIKAKKIIGIIKHLNVFLPFKTLNVMYKTLVRSHFDYCDVVYDIPQLINPVNFESKLHYLMENIEKVQYQAALAVTGAWQGSNRMKLYENIGWESLSERRLFKRLLQLHKIITGNTPLYLKNNFHQTETILSLFHMFFRTKDVGRICIKAVFIQMQHLLGITLDLSLKSFPLFHV